LNTHASLDALKLLQDRARDERDRAAGELRQGEDLLQRTRLMAGQLGDYRVEYTQRWSAQFGRGGAIEIVHCYQSFMQRLDEALAQQQHQVQAAERAVAAARQKLLQAELRAASVGKLIERREAELGRARQRREQRQDDEIAQQLAQRRSAMPI
jgi:flagellar FliJ protein